MRRSSNGARRKATAALVSALIIAVAGARDPAVGSGIDDPARLMDPMSELVGNPDTWSVSRTDAGCYLMSPRRASTSSVAIGQHPRLGLGLFVAGFALSVPNANNGEPVVIRADGQDLAGVGKIAGIQLLFVPLDSAEVARTVTSVKDNDMLWLVLRHTSIGHGGKSAAAAVLQYEQGCAAGKAGSR